MLTKLTTSDECGKNRETVLIGAIIEVGGMAMGSTTPYAQLGAFMLYVGLVLVFVGALRKPKILNPKLSDPAQVEAKEGGG